MALGGLGAMCRYLCDLAISALFGRHLPWGTMAINVVGSGVAGLLIGITDTACKYWVPQFGAFFIYAATIGLLLWRPMGLFGKRA